MKFNSFLKDRLYSIVTALFCYFIILLVLLAYKSDKAIVIAITIILLVTYILLFLTDFFRKQKFYTDLLTNIDNLDKAYLVLETLNRPEFYEGELLCQALYEIDKSMNENVRIEKEQLLDNKEYIEMWIHEVKRPLASLVLTLNNQKNILDRKTKNILKRLEDYVDQVLYYVRSENAEKDYFIKEVDLSKVIKNVGIKNMDDLLDNKVEFIVDKTNYKVFTDSKWLEFILNQIINNSIKYKRNIDNSYIKIYVKDNLDTTVLIIEDNGIGIKSSDIRQVFDKTFTGTNGREKTTSTGMGLYIAKNLCKKLGHKIEIESKENEYTRVFITFAKNKFYDVLK
ncbi:MAG: sensor histidine kinase [Tenericutes bacterium]|nr:sensor histidine kinase [Mycoplasmatota bacterium]